MSLENFKHEESSVEGMFSLENKLEQIIQNIGEESLAEGVFHEGYFLELLKREGFLKEERSFVCELVHDPERKELLVVMIIKDLEGEQIDLSVDFKDVLKVKRVGPVFGDRDNIKSNITTTGFSETEKSNIRNQFEGVVFEALKEGGFYEEYFVKILKQELGATLSADVPYELTYDPERKTLDVLVRITKDNSEYASLRVCLNEVFQVIG